MHKAVKLNRSASILRQMPSRNLCKIAHFEGRPLRIFARAKLDFRNAAPPKNIYECRGREVALDGEGRSQYE